MHTFCMGMHAHRSALLNDSMCIDSIIARVRIGGGISEADDEEDAEEEQAARTR